METTIMGYIGIILNFELSCRTSRMLFFGHARIKEVIVFSRSDGSQVTGGRAVGFRPQGCCGWIWVILGLRVQSWGGYSFLQKLGTQRLDFMKGSRALHGLAS